MSEDKDYAVALTESLWDDPDAGPELRKLIAKKHPKARTMPQFADVVVGEKAEATLKEIERHRQEWAAERQRDAGARTRELAHEKLRAQGYTDDDIAAIEKIMTDPNEPSANFAAAAALYKQQRVVAAPKADIASKRMQVPGVNGAGGEWFKGHNGGPSITENASEWAISAAEQVIHDFQTGNGAKHL